MANSRQEIHKQIWSIADGMRGSMKWAEFMPYILTAMAYRFVSEQLEKYLEKDETEGFKYASDVEDAVAECSRAEITTELGYFILPSDCFSNVVERAKTDNDININLKDVFERIEQSSPDGIFKGIFVYGFDCSANRFGGSVDQANKAIRGILQGVTDMDLGDISDNSIDSFGDAYEFILNEVAGNSKSNTDGEYFTPQCVSQLLTLITLGDKTHVDSVYDPTCGSGSLLLTVARELAKRNGHTDTGDFIGSLDRSMFGQELQTTTYNLARVNMLLHGVGYKKYDIKCGDTLLEPKHLGEKPFSIVVSNPPYSTSWEGADNALMVQDERFTPAGVLAPKSKADLAFVMHSLNHLANDGIAAIVVFPGILYRSGAEQKIRKHLIDTNVVDAVIQLPTNLFYGTSIATCIMVLKKNKPDTNTLFIDASGMFEKVTNNNVLTDEHITELVKFYSERQAVEYTVAVVSSEFIAEKDYNLSVSTYVEQEDKREVIDINILNAKIKGIVGREEALRGEIDSIVAEIEGAANE